MELKTTPNRPSKLTGMDKSRLPAFFAATITLSEDGYTPDYVELRGRITADIITANLTHDSLEQLEADPKVKSVNVGGKIRPV